MSVLFCWPSACERCRGPPLHRFWNFQNDETEDRKCRITILSADLAHIADVLNQRIAIEVEAQIDEVGQSVETLKLHRLVKLIFLIAEKAVHPFSEVVDFIEIDESVLEAAEFLGEYDLGHIQFKGCDILGMDSFERRIHFLFCAGKAEVGLAVSVFYFQFNHGNSP